MDQYFNFVRNVTQGVIGAESWLPRAAPIPLGSLEIDQRAKHRIEDLFE